MAHNLEEFENGQVAFALRGEPAWHNLTNHTFTEDEDVTTQQMLDSALLSKWNVRLEDIALPENYTCDKPNFLVVRDHPVNVDEVNVLATVGARYHTYQNEDLFAFGDGLLSKNALDGVQGGYWESAGSINGGRTVFGSLKLNKEITLDGQGINDKTAMYLLVTTSHDGSTAIQAMTTPVRVVCQNTLNFALRGSQRSYKVRHTASAQGRVDEAQQTLGLAYAYADKFEAEAQALFATEISDKQFMDIVTTLYPAPEADAGKASLTKYDSKIDQIKDLYFVSPTQFGIKGTAWGAVNALTERIDYGRQIRKGSNVSAMSSASGFDAQVNAEKGRILSVVKTLASV